MKNPDQVLTEIDWLLDHGTLEERRAAYDLLLCLGGSIGSDGVPRVHRKSDDMICKSCRDQEHERCQGHTWCDCQHKTESALSPEDEPKPVVE